MLAVDLLAGDSKMINMDESTELINAKGNAYNEVLFCWKQTTDTFFKLISAPEVSADQPIKKFWLFMKTHMFLCRFPD